jgi:regulatory protein
MLIAVDGGRFVSLPIEHVDALGLREGLELEGDALRRFEEVVEREGAWQKALRLLAARPRGSWEMQQRLKSRGFNASAAAEAVGRLESAGLLDDVAFTQQFARSRAEKGHGPSRILSDLLHRGVDRSLAERAIAEAVTIEEGDLLGQAEELARKRARQLGNLPPEKKVRRIVGYLARRGHGGGAVVAMVRRVVEENSG